MEWNFKLNFYVLTRISFPFYPFKLQFIISIYSFVQCFYKNWKWNWAFLHHDPGRNQPSHFFSIIAHSLRSRPQIWQVHDFGKEVKIFLKRVTELFRSEILLKNWKLASFQDFEKNVTYMRQKYCFEYAKKLRPTLWFLRATEYHQAGLQDFKNSD